MNTSENDVKVKNLRFAGENMVVVLSNRTTITVPLKDFSRLATAKAEILSKWQPVAAGKGIHWEELDEDISIAGLLHDYPIQVSGTF